MNKKCLLDMDGIITDFVSAAIVWHDLPRDLYDRPESLGEFDIVALSGMKAGEFWSPLGYDFWSKLSWTSDGQKIVNLVVKHFGLDNVCILSAPCATPGCADAKIAWIKRELPEFKNRFLLGAKKEFCARADNWLIDDRDKNVEAFQIHGGNSILLPRPWNKEYPNRHRSLEFLKEQLSKL